MLNFGNWARFEWGELACSAQFSKYLCFKLKIDTCMNNETWFAYFGPLCFKELVCLQIILSYPQMTQNLLKSGQKSLSFLLLSMTYFKWFLPTVYSAELWDMTDCFTSYARIRIKTRVPPERGRSSWQLGQVLQVGRGPRWRRGKGIISSSCLGSWFSITVSMMIHVGVASFIASTFFLQSWSSPFFIVYKIGHSSS